MTPYISRLGIAALLTLAACSSHDPEDTTQSASQDLCVGGSNVEGVDVSGNQPSPITWSAVKTVAGAFAFTKASEGTGFVDGTFSANWPALRAAGFTRGAYQFFRGSVDGIAQADTFLSVVSANGGFQAGDLPPAVDLEVIGLTGNTASDLARFRDTVHELETRTGRLPIIYTNNNTWGLLGNPSGFDAYPVWLANWDAQCTNLPPGLTNLKFWQYTSTGSVPGISGNVDRDRFNGTASDLLAFAGGAPGGPTTCDNNVPVGSTACNPADPGAQFVCTNPGLPSSQQWTRQACPTGQSCSGTQCQAQGGSCSCSGGSTFWGTQVPASDTSCGFQVCGGDNQLYACQSDGWHAAGGSPCNCRCANGADSQGRSINPDYTYCGYTVCGADLQHYTCTASGWSAQHDTCH